MIGKDDLVFIEHILDAIDDIQSSIKNLSKKEFVEIGDVRDATIRRIEVIGEAVKNMSENLKNKHREIEWKKISGTRDRLIHSYFNVDLDITWDIIKKDIPVLKKHIEKIKKELK